MNSASRFILCLIWFATVWLFFWAIPGVASADWPAHRGNRQRTNFVEQDLDARRWVPAWRNDSLSPPTPAWPPPARGSLWQKLDHIEPRVTDDQADVPLIVLDENKAAHLLVASSANDRLLSLEPSSGEIQWQVITQAPIRYAPSVHDGVAYLGADDGLVRAIQLSTGRQIWSVRVGPEMPWIIGNDRFVSPHPIRTSVLADDRFVYASAGLCPSQKVYLVALDRSDGSVAWRRQTDKSPQGYLLATNDHKVYIPTGRATPFAIDADNGKPLFDLPSPGGSFCMLTPDAFFSGPGNGAKVQAKATHKAAKVLSFDGRQVVAGGGKIWTANGRQLVCVDAAAVASGDLTPKWAVDCALDSAILGTGTAESPLVFVGRDANIQVHDGNDGRLIETLELPEGADEIKYLAVTGRHENCPELLVATCVSGNVYAWRGAMKPAGSNWPGAKRKPVPSVEAAPDAKSRIKEIVSHLPVDRGWALVLGDDDGALTRSILSQSQFKVVSIVNDAASSESLRSSFQAQGVYGHQVVVWNLAPSASLPIAPGLFNFVVEGASSQYPETRMMSMLVDKIGVLSLASGKQKIQPALKDAGAWLHQYASSNNQADSRDPYVGEAAGFRLQWFGGVGPSRMPDRHLRGPSPLAAGAALVMQGDGVLIGVDPANGTERWQRELPQGAMRYVTPFDAGYASMTAAGDQLLIAAGKQLWRLDAYTGRQLDSIEFPLGEGELNWGYVVQTGDSIYATGMKSTAPRTAQDQKTRYTFVNNDYNSDRPLVTSRTIVKLNAKGELNWSYGGDGVISHGSLAVDPLQSRMIFLEGCSADCLDHASDQIALTTLLQDARLVCLNTITGDLEWEESIEWSSAKNVIYGQLVDGKVLLTTSESVDGKANYAVRAFSAVDGTQIWETKHRHVRSGLFHGEQVHHPVVLTQPNGSQLLVAEPFLYDLSSGKRVVPEGAPKDWALIRPGHSCGTLSGAGHCLFFRAGNPTVLDLSQPGGNSFTALAPTRAGCWINMIPAAGRLLIPEGSASCVCNYSLQTSMAFVPLNQSELESELPELQDVEPVH